MAAVTAPPLLCLLELPHLVCGTSPNLSMHDTCIRHHFALQGSGRGSDNKSGRMATLPSHFLWQTPRMPRCSPRTIEQLEHSTSMSGAEACANLQARVVPRLQAVQRRVADAAMRPCRPRRLAHPQPTHRARRPRRELRQRAAAPAAAALGARRRLQVAAASLAACCSTSRCSTLTAAISRSYTSIGSWLLAFRSSRADTPKDSVPVRQP